MKKNIRINTELPCWDGYRDSLQSLAGLNIPTAAALTQLLPPGAVNQRGLPIRFVPAAELAAGDYEKRIYETGEVSTREQSWHDFFNALAWCRFPKLKAAMNARHYAELGSAAAGRRGRVRDALTLFDESGVIVSGSERSVLAAVAGKDWQAGFVAARDSWGSVLKVSVCGHALLEKFLDPYKSVTAHALLLHIPGETTAVDLDDRLGRAILEDRVLDTPGSLAPIPLMGIPGWWQEGPQDEAFYGDLDVFRPDSGRRPPAPIHTVSAD